MLTDAVGDLPSNQIHLWIQRLTPSRHVHGALASLLSADERQRAARFRFDRDRTRFLVARGRLRQILASYLELHPATLAFHYNSFGKPFLAPSAHGTPALRFNLSHSGDIAAYAIARDREVGIDIERVRRDFESDGIPERFFSPAEVADLRSLPPHQQAEAFFRCWTRKEAYVKARSQGLSIPLDSFDVSLRPGEPARLLRNGAGFSLRSFRVKPEYVGAIVADGRDWEVKRIANP